VLTSAVVTVGTELVTGLVIDTNAAEIGLALTAAGFDVSERVSVGDDESVLERLLRRLTDSCALVVVTGGLGPTHDDITREAASRALDVPLIRDERIAERLRAVAARHAEPEAAEQVFRQADVLQGARVLSPAIGTAPGQVAETPAGHLVLLPGPPREMRGMLADALAALGLGDAARPVVLSATGMPESDVQVVVQRELGGRGDVGFTVLSRPGEVRAVLFDRGAGRAAVLTVSAAICEALGDACFSTTGETLAEAVLREAREAGATIATAESCTGGMIAAALTDIPGSSDVFLGGVVSYSNELKRAALRVTESTLREHGAVSPETAEEMVCGISELTGADVCVSVTGVAGPGGGSAEKPVGTVWFGLLTSGSCVMIPRLYPGDRATVRIRATAAALDLMRLGIRELRG
jgi:nicotinamide-nucleotide amidase